MPSLTDLTVDFVSLVDRAAVRDPVNQSDPMRFLVWKRDNNAPEGGSMTPEEKAALDKAQADQKAAETASATAKAELATAQEQIATLTKSVDELKKAAGVEVEPTPVDKSDWPESARVAFEKAEADRVADRARLEKAEEDAAADREIAKTERDQRLTATFITKAEGYKALVIKAEDFGPVLKEASEKLSKESYAALEQVLKAADEGLATTDLFKEQGRARAAATPDSAYGEAVSRAAELRKSDTSLTEAKAIQAVFKADPTLAARHLAEQRA